MVIFYRTAARQVFYFVLKLDQTGYKGLSPFKLY